MDAITRAVRGMRDKLPDEMERISMIISEARRISHLYGYREVVYHKRKIYAGSRIIVIRMISSL
jgi:hypothetical protein